MHCARVAVVTGGWCERSSPATIGTCRERTPAGRIGSAAVAVVTRSILIDAPVESVFAHCATTEDYPLIIEDIEVRPVGQGRLAWASTGRGLCGEHRSGELLILRQEPSRLLVWAQAGSFPVNVTLAFAPLAGEATWLTCNLELPVGSGEPNVAPRLAAIAAWLNGMLSSLRAFVEARYLPSEEQPGPIERNSGAR